MMEYNYMISNNAQDNTYTGFSYTRDFTIFNKPRSLVMVFFFVKMLIFRCFILCKKRWRKFLEKILLSKGKKHLLLMFCLGFCNCIATTPFCVIVILPLTFGSFFYILEKRLDKPVLTQLLTIFAFLFGHFTSIFWWFFVPLTTDFSRLFWLVPFATFGLPSLIAGILTLFFTVFILIWRTFFLKKKQTLFSADAKEALFVVIFLLCWFLGEYVRGHFIFGGFPWMLFGHYITYAFAIQSVGFLGIDVYSVCFLILVLTPYFLIFKKHNKYIRYISWFVVIGWAINCLFGVSKLLFSKVDNDLGVNILASQANITAKPYVDDEQARETFNKNIKILSVLSKTMQPTLMLMPEGSINFNLDSGDALTRYLGRLVPNDSSLLLAGGIDMHGVSPYNVIYAINNDGHILDLYKKQKLVPFGEYIPFRRFFPHFIRSIVGYDFDFATDGDNNLFIFYKDLPIIYPIICYESIFTDYVNNNIESSRKKISNDLLIKSIDRAKIKTLQDKKEIIVNLTNDAWMKWSIAPYQHFLMVRFLAVTVGLPVIRVSNNGISAYIDKYGRILTKTALNKEDILFVGKFKRKY